MTLDTGKINETYTIEKIDLPLKLEKRLEALGMTGELPSWFSMPRAGER